MASRPRQTVLRLESLERRELLSVNAANLLAHGAVSAASASDDYGNTFAQATAVSLSSAGAGSQTGKIDQAGDADMFKIVAPVTGTMTLSESAASGSRLDSYLYVYGANQNLLARNDDSGGTLNSRVTLNVVAGTTYYVKAAAYNRSTGAYVVQFASNGTALTSDDFGNTFAQATALSPFSEGAAKQSGKIDQAGDADMFKIVAPVTGTMTLSESAAAGSQLDSYLYIYDANQNPLARNDDSGGTLNSSLTLEVVAGTTYYIKAGAYGTSTGAYTLQCSTAAAASSGSSSGGTGTTTSASTGNFQIDVSMSGLTAAEQQTVQQAVDRWEQIIVGDLPDVTYNGQTIDDIHIDISAVTVDGAGGILGQSTATAYRSGSELPYLGYIQLDTADAASMQSSGSLLGVLEHEIAHVLGFGVIWSDLGLLTGTNSSNPGFTGANAVAEYNALFGTNASAVPVEADGSAGTRLSHWDETVFGNELMTGWYNSGQTNPLSRITVASLADLGYTVNLAAADAYTPASSSVAHAALANGVTSSATSTSARISALSPAAERLTALDQVFGDYRA